MNRKTTGQVINYISVVGFCAIFSGDAMARQPVVETEIRPPLIKHDRDIKIPERSMTEDAQELITTPAKIWQLPLASDVDGLT